MKLMRHIVGWKQERNQTLASLYVDSHTANVYMLFCYFSFKMLRSKMGRKKRKTLTSGWNMCDTLSEGEINNNNNNDNFPGCSEINVTAT